MPAGHEAEYLRKGLTELAYRVDIAHDVGDALFHCAEAPYDALIAMLDDVAQADVVALDAGCADAALIVITRDDSSTARAGLLRAGADACMSRPWSFIELQARLQTFERRARIGNATPRTNASSGAASIDPVAGAAPSPRAATPGRASFRLDAASRSLIAEHAAVPLSRREFLVLECLMRDIDITISRDTLLDYAWTPDEHADASTVNTLISRLRAKSSAAGVTLPVETVVGHGYRFIASVA
ncbi:response regulator transcription factor [Pararobbsia silviterrae]|uniref:response regulator transcription factor n=1 Tax=Pararobbsia silviterrae TaxID=1792498 RepID=UPI00131448FD|nr:response regulator transcription factor [Pararobbsia silviterrae]